MPALRARAAAGLRRLLVLFAVIAGCGVVELASAAPASAHAFLWDSNPSDGAVLAAAPENLRLEFSEGVLLSATRVDLVDSAGKHYTPTNLRTVEGASAVGGNRPTEVVATLPALPRSTYRVSWETISTDDLHVTRGVIVFGIATPVHAAGLAEPMPKPDEASIRWALFGMLSISTGGVVTAGLFRRQRVSAADAAARRVLRLAAIGGALGIVAGAVLLIDQTAGGGLGLREVALSSYGARWALRECGFAGLAAGALLALRDGWTARRAAAFCAGGGVALVGVGSALLGHSGAGKPLSPTRLAADALHLAAAATWAGMLVAAVVVVVPMLRKGGTAAAAARLVLRRYAKPAGGCLTVMVVTGLYLASSVVGSVDAAILTIYGRALLVKVALVIVAASLGLINTLRLRRRHVPANLRRTVLAECIAAVLVLGLAALLTSGQPAREPRFVTVPAPPAVPVVDGGVADLQEAVAIRPNQPGHNVILVDVFDTRRPSPGPVRTVTVTLLGLDGTRSTPLHGQLMTDGRWSVPVDLNAPGRIRVQVDAGRQGLPVVTQTFAWTVGGAPAATRTATISTASLRSTLQAAAITAGLICLAAWAIALSGRRRARRRPGKSTAVEEVAGSMESQIGVGARDG